MHHHTRWLIYVILLVFIGVMAFLFFHKLHSPAPLPETIDAPVPSHVEKNYREIHDTSTTPYSTATITYPEFTNVDPTFNTRIRTFVDSVVKEFEQASTDNWKAYREGAYEAGDPGKYPTDPFPFTLTWELVRADDAYISFLIRYEGYSGGAHGYHNLASFNYDVVTHKELTLRDLFPGDPYYLDKVSAFSRTALLASLSADIPLDEMSSPEDRDTYINETIKPMIEEGTTPTDINFSVFTFTDTDITFYFGEYQVASYAAGIQKVVMPR